MRLVIIMPVFNDWEAAADLCAMIDSEFAKMPPVTVSVLIIDDGSDRAPDQFFEGARLDGVEAISVLRLRRNLGHQRAIAVALGFVQERMTCDAVVVMDADGEDRPADISKLLEELRRSPHPVAVFAERGKRVETLKFKIFYHCYRALHFVLTGRGIRIGNFSVLPVEHLESIVAYPELWNHYAATVVNSRLPYSTIRVDRGYRLRGKSQMSFVDLVIHGLSALFAYHDVVSTRFVIGSSLLALVFAVLVSAIFFLQIQTKLAIPAWLALLAALLFFSTLQCLGTSLSVLFTVVINRRVIGFLALRDYSHFVLRCRVIKAR